MNCDSSDTSIGQYEEAYGLEPDAEAIDRAEEVMAALSGAKIPRDFTGRRIRPGDWVVRAIGGKGSASLRYGRVWPADKLTKARAEMVANGKPVAPHLIVYEASGRTRPGRDAHNPFGVSKGTFSEGSQCVIVDKAQVADALLPALDRDRSTLDAEREGLKRHAEDRRLQWEAAKAKKLEAIVR